MSGTNPHTYLADVLGRIAEHPRRELSALGTGYYSPAHPRAGQPKPRPTADAYTCPADHAVVGCLEAEGEHTRQQVNFQNVQKQAQRLNAVSLCNHSGKCAGLDTTFDGCYSCPKRGSSNRERQASPESSKAVPNRNGVYVVSGPSARDASLEITIPHVTKKTFLEAFSERETLFVSYTPFAFSLGAVGSFFFVRIVYVLGSVQHGNEQRVEHRPGQGHGAVLALHGLQTLVDCARHVFRYRKAKTLAQGAEDGIETWWRSRVLSAVHRCRLTALPSGSPALGARAE